MIRRKLVEVDGDNRVLHVWASGNICNLVLLKLQNEPISMLCDGFKKQRDFIVGRVFGTFVFGRTIDGR